MLHGINKYTCFVANGSRECMYMLRKKIFSECYNNDIINLRQDTKLFTIIHDFLLYYLTYKDSYSLTDSSLHFPVCVFYFAHFIVQYMQTVSLYNLKKYRVFICSLVCLFYAFFSFVDKTSTRHLSYAQNYQNIYQNISWGGGGEHTPEELLS